MGGFESGLLICCGPAVVGATLAVMVVVVATGSCFLHSAAPRLGVAACTFAVLLSASLSAGGWRCHDAVQ